MHIPRGDQKNLAIFLERKMKMKYNIAKMKAKQFATERKKPVYIAKSNKSGDYKLEFEEKTTPNFKIIETITPN